MPKSKIKKLQGKVLYLVLKEFIGEKKTMAMYKEFQGDFILLSRNINRYIFNDKELEIYNFYRKGAEPKRPVKTKMVQLTADNYNLSFGVVKRIVNNLSILERVGNIKFLKDTGVYISSYNKYTLIFIRMFGAIGYRDTMKIYDRFKDVRMYFITMKELMKEATGTKMAEEYVVLKKEEIYSNNHIYKTLGKKYGIGVQAVERTVKRFL